MLTDKYNVGDLIQTHSWQTTNVIAIVVEKDTIFYTYKFIKHYDKNAIGSIIKFSKKIIDSKWKLHKKATKLSTLLYKC